MKNVKGFLKCEINLDRNWKNLQLVCLRFVGVFDVIYLREAEPDVLCRTSVLYAEFFCNKCIKGFVS